MLTAVATTNIIMTAMAHFLFKTGAPNNANRSQLDKGYDDSGTNC